ncbi:hypothetical protein [Mesorhizobium delmotii]|uniref:hypothetical protein n=1 Tax=Mesorhizobium delmotii TaxID=1631247 RepID=UPI001FCE56AE
MRDNLATGMSVSAVAKKFATSRQTLMRVRDEGSRSVRPVSGGTGSAPTSHRDCHQNVTRAN